MFHIFYLPFATLHVNPVRKSPPSRTVVRRGVNVKSLGQIIPIHLAELNGRRTRFVKWFVFELVSLLVRGSPPPSWPQTARKVCPNCRYMLLEAKDEPWQTCLSARQHFKFLKLDVSKLRHVKYQTRIQSVMAWHDSTLLKKGIELTDDNAAVSCSCRMLVRI